MEIGNPLKFMLINNEIIIKVFSFILDLVAAELIDIANEVVDIKNCHILVIIIYKIKK